MNVNINPRGHSFRGVTAYLMHDKGAETSERVGRTSTRNLHTDDIEKSSRWMAWTDQNSRFIQQENGGGGAGAPARAGNTYHLSLAWRPDDQPTWEHMEETAHAAMERRGLHEHQYFLVEHTDEPHKHLHIVVNLVHPQTGRINNPWKDREVLDRWANEYEQQHGIQCENRAQKYEAWEQGREAFRSKKLDHTKTVTRAYRQSDSGRAFQHALEAEGLELAQGKRRSYVVVDRNGDVFNLTRCIDFEDGVTGRGKTNAIAARLADLDREELPQADTLAADRRSIDRDGQEVEQQKTLAEAADRAGQQRAQDEVRNERKREQAERGQSEREKRKRWQEYQRTIDRKTAESRKTWQIDELTASKAKAERDVEGLGGFWSRMFKGAERREALDRLDNVSKQLEERTWRFKADVEAFNERRPAWIQERELKRHGLSRDPEQRPEPDRGPERSVQKIDERKPQPPSPAPEQKPEPPSTPPEQRRQASLDAYEASRAADREALQARMTEEQQNPGLNQERGGREIG